MTGHWRVIPQIFKTLPIIQLVKCKQSNLACLDVKRCTVDKSDTHFYTVAVIGTQWSQSSGLQRVHNADMAIVLTFQNRQRTYTHRYNVYYGKIVVNMKKKFHYNALCVPLCHNCVLKLWHMGKHSIKYCLRHQAALCDVAFRGIKHFQCLVLMQHFLW